MALYGTLAAFLSEFLTTALLVICSCFAATAYEGSTVSLSVTALSAGLTQLVLMNCFGHISGAHGNPAISLAIWWLGSLKLRRLLIYSFAQIAGAIVGYYLVRNILDETQADELSKFVLESDLEDLNLFYMEFLLTFVLVMTWCALWDQENVSLELYLAIVNAIVCLMAGHFTGSSVNPARTLTSVFSSNKTKKMFIVLAGELSAAIAAPVLLQVFRKVSGWVKVSFTK